MIGGAVSPPPLTLAMVASTATITLALVVTLVLLGAAMIALAVWLVRTTRSDSVALGPLEVMGDRAWRRADAERRTSTLDHARPPGSPPPAPMVPINDDVVAPVEPAADSAPASTAMAEESKSDLKTDSLSAGEASAPGSESVLKHESRADAAATAEGEVARSVAPVVKASEGEASVAPTVEASGSDAAGSVAPEGDAHNGNEPPGEGEASGATDHETAKSSSRAPGQAEPETESGDAESGPRRA